MITPLGWLERIPTYKEQIDNITNKDLHTYGFLGYPTLQTADIVMYSEPGKSLFVPVGEDQVSHVEFSRELVRRFNAFYGLSINEILFDVMEVSNLQKAKHDALLAANPFIDAMANDVIRKGGKLSTENRALLRSAIQKKASEDGVGNFLESFDKSLGYFSFEEKLTEPQVLLTRTPRVPGLDGRKMSKSYGNAITLSESDADIRAKTKVMVTDPARKRRTDPGNPDVCPVYDWHKLFSTPERDPGRLEWVREGCTTAGIGCIECKAAMAENLIKWIAPIRERRLHYEQHPKQVLEILDQGSAKAKQFAKQTMQRVRDSIFHWPEKRASL